MDTLHCMSKLLVAEIDSNTLTSFLSCSIHNLAKVSDLTSHPGHQLLTVHKRLSTSLFLNS